jgi:hypothetical protein
MMLDARPIPRAAGSTGAIDSMNGGAGRPAARAPITDPGSVCNLSAPDIKHHFGPTIPSADLTWCNLH